MLEYSRAIYRTIADDIDAGPHVCAADARRHVLHACEACMERLEADRRYFARPARTLFLEIRWCFPVGAQEKVCRTVHEVVAAAERHVDEVTPFGRRADGSVHRCPAYTRQGTPCRRAPVPGARHCPSHRYLDWEPAAA